MLPLFVFNLENSGINQMPRDLRTRDATAAAGRWQRSSRQ
jgi:hypothetical protein